MVSIEGRQDHEESISRTVLLFDCYLTFLNLNLLICQIRKLFYQLPKVSLTVNLLF